MHESLVSSLRITQSVSIRNASRLSLFGDIIGICEENLTKHYKYALWRKAEFCDITASGRPALAYQW